MAAALCGILLAARRIRHRRLLTLGRLRTLRPHESGGLLPEAAQRYCLPLLHPVPPAPPAHGGRALRPRPRGHPQGRPADRHQPHERRRLAVSAPLPHGFAGRSPARCLLGRRPELGIPDLRLGAHVAGRLRLVAGPPAQDVGVFRCLPHRPHPRLLPYLGDPRRCRPRTVGTLQPRHALPGRRVARHGIRPRGGSLHDSADRRVDPRALVRRTGRRGSHQIPPQRASAAGLRHTAQGAATLPGRRRAVEAPARRIPGSARRRTLRRGPLPQGTLPPPHRSPIDLLLPVALPPTAGGLQPPARRLLLPPPRPVLAGIGPTQAADAAPSHRHARLRRGPRHDPRLRPRDDAGAEDPLARDPAHAQITLRDVRRSGALPLPERLHHLDPRHEPAAGLVGGGPQRHGPFLPRGAARRGRHAVVLRTVDLPPHHRHAPLVAGDVHDPAPAGLAVDGRRAAPADARPGAHQRPGHPALLLALPHAPNPGAAAR
ncbi:unknown [Alistipes sp. CAG:268]|nr:unknown [Alistipes sp. CAG:268]